MAWRRCRWVRGRHDPPDGGEPLETLNELDAPFVLFGRPPSQAVNKSRTQAVPYGWVDVDNRQGMRLGVDHLLDCGHRSIAYLGPSPTVDHVSDDRWRGYAEAIQIAGLEPQPVYVSYDEMLPTLRPPLEKLFKTEVTAVAAFSDDLAIEMMRFAMAVGRHIGGEVSNNDLAVVGYDNSEKARLGLTSVRQPVEEISRNLVIALQETIRNYGRPHHVVLPCELVVRDSTVTAVAI